MNVSESVSTHTSSVIFGLDPLYTSLAILVVVYGIIMTEKYNRAVLSLVGAGLMILSGVITQTAAIEGIDFNTIGLLTGMMVIVTITQKTGIFQYVAIKSAKLVRGRPVSIMFMLALVTALFSSLLDNVTTVLLVTPVALLLVEALHINPLPYLFTIIFSSNIGGSATLIGDPPNIMIGSAANLSFNDFLTHVAPVIPLIMAATLVIITLVFRKSFVTTQENIDRVMEFNENGALTDSTLLKQSLSVLFLALVGFSLGHSYHIEPATVAMFGAAILLLIQTFFHSVEDQDHNFEHVMSEVEWITIFFFVGLFVIVTGIEHTGFLGMISSEIVSLTGGSHELTVGAVLWVSALASALIDNIPFVASMIPVIQSMSDTFTPYQIETLWWALSLGACLGGNGSLVGASANLIVAGFAQRAGHPISFLVFLKYAFFMMLISIAISHAYLYIMYL